jgi:Tol biopolymer transport system component
VYFTSRNPAPALLFLAGILGLGCTDSTSPTRSILVTITTTGSSANLDPDGYMLTVDDKPASPVASNVTFTITDVALGKHEFLLSGVQANCIIDGNNPRSIDVAPSKTGTAATVTFNVGCGAKTGAIHVRTVTTGSEIDANGYSVIVGGGVRGIVASNGTLVVEGLAEGGWEITLQGVAINCTVDAPLFRSVTVTFGQPVVVEYFVRCVPTITMQITMTTTGVDLDSNGYTFNLQVPGSDFLATDAIKTNGTTTVSGLVTGDYRLTLLDIAPNCDAVTTNPQTVSAAAGSSTVNLQVACEQARQLAFVSGTGPSSEIHIINSNEAGGFPIVSNPGADIDPAWSPDGSKLAFTSDRDGAGLHVYTRGADGTVVRLTQSFGGYRPAWSPDGARIAFVSERSGHAQIYIMDADGSNQVRITNYPSHDTDPAWSPDGTKIAFTSDRGGDIAIWVMNADGSGAKALTTNPRGDSQPAWSPDGTKIAFSRVVSTNARDIWIMNADGTLLAPLTNGFAGAQDPSWSPDGRRIALSSPSCDSYYYYYYNCDAVIYVVSLDGAVHSPLTSPSAAYNPTWRP